MDDRATKGARRRPRLAAIDVARGAALAAMAIYHFTWDLEFFGYVTQGTTGFGGWKLFARCIASSFLFLVGISLVLAHAEGVRWRPFGRRLAMVAGAALLITAATRIAMPEAFIFFGILHQIALASLLGLAFLRLPPLANLLAAALFIAAPHFLRSTLFDHSALWWSGLQTITPRSNDYVPLFPWFGAVLAGMAAAQSACRAGLDRRIAGFATPRPLAPLAFAGRHSLAVYLLHQPLLLACVWLFSQIMPPAAPDPAVSFTHACQASCSEVRDSSFCSRYCDCMLDVLAAEQALDAIVTGMATPAQNARAEENAAACTMEAEGGEAQ